jgi:low temperature requirement protein LtrA
VIWASAIAGESGQLLQQDRDAVQRARSEHDWGELKPKDPSEALDAHHFAERFGLFLIILLGEVVVEAGKGAEHAGWFTLATAMVLAGALWWIYFDAAVEVNLQVLELSGGSPTMARAIFAVGHMVPAFSLLVIAGGIGSLMEAEEPVANAYWFACLGLGAYLCSTRVFFGKRFMALRILLIVGIFSLGRWHESLSGEQYVWLLAAIGVVCAAVASTTSISALLRRVG